MTGTERITRERQRQIEQEGWTAEHDDKEHKSGNLAEAAMAYANASIRQMQMGGIWGKEMPKWWPWDSKWWKPSDDPVRNLEKAGALIAAEIDRILRHRGHFVTYDNLRQIDIHDND